MAGGRAGAPLAALPSAAPLVGGDSPPPPRARRGPAFRRHRLAALLERHRAAAPGAGAVVLVAAHVVAEAVELRVDAGAVQALGVVLDDRLPVRVDLVGDRGVALELAESVVLEVPGEVAEVVVERAGDARDVGEQEPVALLHADRAEA